MSALLPACVVVSAVGSGCEVSAAATVAVSVLELQDGSIVDVDSG